MQQPEEEEEDWKEYRIHVGKDSGESNEEEDADDAEYIRYVSHNLFDSQEVDGDGESEYFEVYKYTVVESDQEDTPFALHCQDEDGKPVPLPSLADGNNADENQETPPMPSDAVVKCQISLRHHLETANSTGLGVWSGTEVLAQHLLSRPTKINNQHVVELGCGVGLCGFVAHMALGAARVTLTDGDSVVLRNLRHNIQLNDVPIQCKQLIWGNKQAKKFLRYYHANEEETLENKIRVVMASECLYMPQSVLPFWEAISVLLRPTVPASEEEDDKIDEVLESDADHRVIYVHGPASQTSIESVLETAQKFGFQYEQVRPRIYEFQRPKQIGRAHV